MRLTTLKNFVILLLFTITTSSIIAQEKLDASYIYGLMEDKTLTRDQVKEKADVYFEQVGIGKGSGNKQFMRWYYEQQFHIDENGYQIPLEVEIKRTIDGLKGMEKTETRSPWVELGPTSFSATSSWNPGMGRARWVDVDPTNNLIMYAASAGGGIWKTIDGGITWFPTMDDKTADHFTPSHVAINPLNTSIVYAALSGNKVVKSTDAGSTWNYVGNSGPTSSRKLLIHPTNPDIVLATSSSGIHRTTDGGTNWTLVQSASGLEDLVISPGNSNIMFSSGSGSQTYWRSTDAGVTWSNISNGITNTGRSLLGISPANSQVVYIVQASGNVFGRLYKSTDGGLSFTTTVTGNPGSGTNYFGYEPNGTGTSGQATYDMAIAVNPTNSEEVHIAGIICWKSTNGGSSFTATTVWSYPNSTGYNHADVHSLKYFGNTLYSTSDGGVCKSNNDAGDWITLWETFGTRQLYRISCAKTEPNTIGCGAQDNGQAYSVAGGAWNQWLGADGMDVAISTTNHNVAIGCIQYGGIYRTTNGGSSYSGLAKPSNGNWVTPIVWHPNDANTVYGGWTGIYRSTNQGSNWTKISGNTIGSALNALAVAPSDVNYIYGSVGSTLYVTTNGGSSWNSYSAGGSITSISVSPTNPSKVYVTTSSTSSNVKVSSNAGATFTTISSGLPSIAARSITVDGNAEESIYVGMNSGVYYRDNNNPAWVVFGSGLPFVAIQDIEIQQSSGKLRLATYGRGVWETDINPSVPTCNAPSNLNATNITTSSADLSWSAVGTAVDYSLEYKETASATWISLGNTTSTSYNLSSLSSDTDYDWRVMTNCVDLNSPFTQASFATNQVCIAAVENFPNNPLTHTGSGTSGTSISFGSPVNNVSFAISGLNSVTGGKPNNRYIDLVKVSYVDEYSNTILHGTYSGNNVSSAVINIANAIQSLTVTLEDGYDGNTNAVLSVSFTQVDHCMLACVTGDSDGDGVCDESDVCPGFDDNLDADNDGIPDGCDNCFNNQQAFGTSNLTHSGTGSSSTSASLTNASDITFTVGNLGAKTNGKKSGKYIDIVNIEYVDGLGATVNLGPYSGASQSSVNVNISGDVQSITVFLTDGFDGNGPSMSVSLTDVDYCETSAPPTPELAKETSELLFTDMIVYPNPSNGFVNVKVTNVKEEKEAQVRIEMLNGQIIRSERVSLLAGSQNIISLDMTNEIPGPYIIHVLGKGINIFSKVIKY